MTPKEIVEELFRRLAAGDDTAVDEFVAEDMVNHAAGPQRQGRDGWKEILASIETDLGRCELETHRVIAEGDMVAHHITLTGPIKPRPCRFSLERRLRTSQLPGPTSTSGASPMARSPSIGPAGTMSACSDRLERGRRNSRLRPRPQRADTEGHERPRTFNV